MKLNVFALGVKLALGVMSKKLAVSAAASKLSVKVAALKVAIALGNFVKTVLAIDIVSIQEQIAKYFTKDITDNIDIQDSPVIVPTKVIGDSAGFSDGEVYFAEDYITGAPSSQTYTEGKQLVWEMLKVLVELPTTISSTLVLTFNRSITDTSNINDSVNIVPNKGINDTTSISETVVSSIGANYVEVPSVQELISKDISVLKTDNYIVSDTPSIGVQQVLANAAALIDTVLLSVTSGLSDTVGAGSTGSLYSQGYVDFSYFAEDYVGDSRVFS